MKKFLWVTVIILTVVLGLVGIGYMVAVVVANHVALSGMTAESRADYKTFKNKKWTFDEADIYPEPFKKETIDAAIQYHQLLTSHSMQTELKLFSREYGKYEQSMRDASHSTTITLPYLREKAESFDSVLYAFEKMARQADYEIMVQGMTKPLTAKELISVYDIPRWVSVERLHILKAEQYVDMGNMENTMEICENMFLGTYSHSNGFQIIGIFGFYPRGKMMDEWLHAVARTDDPARIRETFNIQKQTLLTDDYVSTGTEFWAKNFVGGIARHASRNGLRLDVQDKTVFFALRDIDEYEARFAREVLLPAANSVQRKEIIERLQHPENIFRHNDYVPQNKILQDLGCPIFVPFLYADLSVGFWDDADFIKSHIVMHRLLLLFTAMRLYAIENGETASSLQALIPEYLEEIPTDPFQGQGFFRGIGDQYYSFGPDGDDDKMKVPYDPTNGSTSNGDIYFKTEGESP